MDTYIEIHKPATEKNDYFLVLDEHDNFENDKILNLLSIINRYIVDVDTSMEQFMKTMMSKFHLYILVNCEGSRGINKGAKLHLGKRIKRVKLEEVDCEEHNFNKPV